MYAGFIIYILIGMAITVCLVGMLKGIKEARKEYREQLDSNEERFYPSSFSTVEEYAVVVDRCCFVDTVGIKHPKTMQRFVVVFETEDGVRKELFVEEAMYDGFEIGQRGLLTIVDGELYGFALA